MADWWGWTAFWRAIPALLLVALAPSSASALRGALVQPPAPRFERIDMLHDFPQGSVYGITERGDGYLWLTTLDGLVRFDGLRSRVFDRTTAPELPTTRFTALYAHRPTGDLWIGTEDGRLILGRGGRFEVFLDVDSTLGAVVGIEVSDAGDRVFVFHYGGLSEYAVVDGDATELRLVGATWRGMGIYGCAALIAGGTLRWVSGGEVRETTLPLELVERPRIACRGDGEGVLWLRAAGTHVWRVEGEAMAIDGREGRIPEDALPLAEDGDGGLWLRFRGAPRLGRLDARGQVIRYDERFGVDPLGDPITFHEDREGGQWIGTSIGFYRYLGDAIAGLRLRADEGGDRVVASHVEADDGAHWVAARDGSLVELRADGELVEYTGRDATGRVVLLPERVRVAAGDLGSEPLGPSAIGAFGRDRRGQIWIGSDLGLMVARGDGVIELYRTKGAGGPIAAGVNDILVEGDALWLSTQGVDRFEGGRVVQSFGRDEGIGTNVKALLRDRHGDLWAATNAGVLRQDGARFTAVAGLGAELGQVRALHEDADGRIWVGTYDRGLYRREPDGRVAHIGAEEGLRGAFTLHFDRRGLLWMTSNRGLVRARVDEVEEAFRGERDRIHTVLYDESAGLPASECNGGFGNAAYPCEGDAWCVHTMGGVGVARVDEVRIISSPPVTVIEEVRVDGERRLFADDRVTLGPDESDVIIRYTGVTFEGAAAVTFRYRLKGHADRWTDGETRREAQFNDLLPGDYVFEVYAVSREGIASPTSALLTVTVEPAWWERSSIRAVVGLLLIVLGAAAVHGRLRHVVRRHRRKEEELRDAAEELEARVRERTAVLKAEVVERRRAEAAAKKASAVKSA
ncbi:MAG: hypothetical protein KC486_35055, partial [Myxococcales bacterium]|nr:hypothetical protein [Myxococcales bacterium]